MDTQPAEKIKEPNLRLEWEVIALGFLLGVSVCLILALIYCMWIITEQDSFIHNLLLNTALRAYPK